MRLLKLYQVDLLALVNRFTHDTRVSCLKESVEWLGSCCAIWSPWVIRIGSGGIFVNRLFGFLLLIVILSLIFYILIVSRAVKRSLNSHGVMSGCEGLWKSKEFIRWNLYRNRNAVWRTWSSDPRRGEYRRRRYNRLTVYRSTQEL